MVTMILLALVSAAEPAARVTGGVAAPATLPAGSIAMYGLVGAPDLGVGYRQGFEVLELEARALFNLLEVSGLVEVGLKLGVLGGGRLQLAPGLALGLKADSGATYFDRANFAYVGLRPRGSLTLSWAVTETITGLAQLEVPMAFALTVRGFQVTPTVGLGAEFHVGGALSVLVSGHAGVDALQEPLGVPQVRPAWAGRIGIGYRLF